MRLSTKCVCGAKNKGTCKKCSAFKVVFMLNNKNKNLKENGKNPVRYSFYSKNNKNSNVTISSMINRLIKSDPELFKGSNLYIVFDNQTNTEIDRVYL